MVIIDYDSLVSPQFVVAAATAEQSNTDSQLTMEITQRPHSQTPSRVFRKCVNHVIEEPYSGPNPYLLAWRILTCMMWSGLLW